MDLLSYESDEEDVDESSKPVELHVINKEFSKIITDINVDNDKVVDQIMSQVNQLDDYTNILTSSVSTNIVEIKQQQQQYPHSLLDTMFPPLIETNVNPLTIQNILDYKERGLNLTETLRSNKQFGNPYILTKVVKTLGIDEIGSNYPVTLFDPHGYDESDFEDSVRSRYSQTLPPLTATTAAAPTAMESTAVSAAATSITSSHRHRYHTTALPDTNHKPIVPSSSSSSSSSSTKQAIEAASIIAAAYAKQQQQQVHQSSQVSSKLAAAASAAAAITSSLLHSSSNTNKASSSSSSSHHRHKDHDNSHRDRSRSRSRDGHRSHHHHRSRSDKASTASTEEDGEDASHQSKRGSSGSRSSKWRRTAAISSSGDGDVDKRNKRSRWDDIEEKE